MIIKPNEIPVLELIDKLELVPYEKGRRKSKNNVDYINIITCFDIETSRIYTEETDPDSNPVYDEDEEKHQRAHSFMYHWQFQLGKDYTITGRTWDEYRILLGNLRKIQHGIRNKYKCQTPHFVCYVHNLSYEWQYLQGEFDFINDECFFRDVRDPLYVRQEHLIEYRCSYLHSNMRLADFAKYMECETQKLSGDEFNYDKIRYPWTPLSEYEFNYCINDVICLEEALRKEMARDGDTLRTLPLTKTGYVRRDCKKAVKPLYYSIRSMLPEMDCYKLLRRCFRGGDTHANRWHVGEIVSDVEGQDIESSYPTIQLTKPFPMGPFRPLEPDKTSTSTLDRVIRLISKGNAVIADYTFKYLRLKDKRDPMPYLPESKCHCYNIVRDNGRILSADLCVTALTEIDLKIVMDQYEFDSISVDNVWTAVKAPLPKAYRDCVINYYTQKTGLKKKTGFENLYAKFKSMLNSIYGMSAQQPIHPIVYFDGDGADELYLKYLPPEEQQEKELLQAPFPYQWGVYTTAYAREALRRGMALIGKDENGVSNLLYCDTDSLYYKGHYDFSGLNKSLAADAKKWGATAKDKNGTIHYIGTWDPQGHYEKFITQGAKRYAYIKNGKMGVTVSGVSHKQNPETGEDYAVTELGSLERFGEGMKWVDAGGTAAVYNDHDNFDYTDPETGKTVHIGPNVAIVPSTYTMTITEDYEQIVKTCALWLKFVKQKEGVYK